MTARDVTSLSAPCVATLTYLSCGTRNISSALVASIILSKVFTGRLRVYALQIRQHLLNNYVSIANIEKWNCFANKRLWRNFWSNWSCGDWSRRHKYVMRAKSRCHKYMIIVKKITFIQKLKLSLSYDEAVICTVLITCAQLIRNSFRVSQAYSPTWYIHARINATVPLKHCKHWDKCTERQLYGFYQKMTCVVGNGKWSMAKYLHEMKVARCYIELGPSDHNVHCMVNVWSENSKASWQYSQ